MDSCLVDVFPASELKDAAENPIRVFGQMSMREIHIPEQRPQSVGKLLRSESARTRLDHGNEMDFQAGTQSCGEPNQGLELERSPPALVAVEGGRTGACPRG